MTNLEAADLLDNLIGMVSDNHDSDYDEALSKGRDILKSEPCEDCINRKRLKECFHRNVVGAEAFDTIIDMQPSIQPKTGHWIINEDEENAVHGHCSVCGWEAHYYEDDIIGMSYCPNCGANMVEPQESEE